AAATHALATGRDRDTAVAAAYGAAGDDAVLRQARGDYSASHRYIEWFVWARANLRLPDDRCHETTQAALQSLAAGGTPQSAADAARITATAPLLPQGGEP